MNSAVRRILPISVCCLLTFFPNSMLPQALAEDEDLGKIEAFIKRYPDSWEGYYKLARYCEEKDARAPALENYAKAIALNPKNGSLYLGKAEMHLMMTQYDKAIAETDAAIKMFPNWPDAYIKRARAASSVEDYVAAKNDLEKALSLIPGDSDALDQLAWSYDGSGNHAKAIEAATKSVIMAEQTSMGSIYYSLQNRAFYFTHAHQYQRAYQDISQSVMAKPKNSQVWAYFAYALAMDNKMDKAKEVFQICQSLDTFPPRAARLRGEMYRAAGDWREALASYKKSTSMEPGYGPGWAQKAMTEIALGDYDEAEKDLLKSLEKTPKSVLSTCLLALAEDQLGKTAPAQEQLDKAMKLDPAFAMNYVVSARINMHKGDYGKAAEDCNQALKLDPFLGDAYAAASTAFKNCGKTGEAKSFLEKAHAMGWKEMEKELLSKAPDTSVSISIDEPAKPDFAQIMKETEKNIGEAAPP